MVGLTERAQALLRRAPWHPAPRDRARIVALLEAEGAPVFEPVVAFQERYGGLELGSLLLGYIDDDGVRAAGYDDEDGHYYFYCAEDINVAPVSFFLDETGAFYAGGNPVVERFETYVEWYALVSGMTRRRGWHSATIGYVRRDDRRLEALIDLPPIPEASDACLRCWGDERVCIVRSANFYNLDYRDDVDVYARRRGDLKLFRARLEGVVQREPTRSAWRELLDILRSR